ncbi:MULTISPECIES: 1,3-beta-galactosyl-N-acetylhexosamine phosphorylase [Hungatella]|uniref:1,3-beta-galactosyl-N-acetylhexosamine phosphorylase n=2 Tax=Hungatella hathewayi TaxID=154046 RepID=A0AA37NFB7_9FIRM|nr:1,3-beta-galactosyl-N-acetylhexosamine phosphorylase [Hungatella hathewayi]MBT9796421.1 1,3-beta-galactosyl-N-acetylhexosamine phosphorylase [Hungatella hathewayi]MDU4973851.1 1,3-beta-galactosyl-N-acetylhexosamine phosphorylase [Hungatella hathewayi]RGZ01137.1 1,3-beta-galactosyl-N-acetylhexosamine phosphorylase [Hungatella hathewayi]GKH03864.1 1,3-beta-galactosyl-N-acetylhexosamine phosphorylase [Hungatella hathewayi]GKH08048.1 1,3-beta-galactosyl-N-acetylhexosamine phosphorylase [Hungate
MSEKYGRVTVPTDVDMIEETKEIVKRWGADALRDCDGTSMPDELKSMPVKIYSTYYTTRKDNPWAEANPDEVQQMYLMTEFYTAMEAGELRIPVMKHLYDQQLKPNTIDDIKRWWEVVDRTTGEVVAPEEWSYDEAAREVIVAQPERYHDYTVSFLAFIIWDPVHMYNFITNSWENVEHQITFDVRQPKTQQHVIDRLKNWMVENPDTDVVRFTTFFHQFTLVFNEYAKEKFVDWFGYSASVSPYILEQFEKEAGYRFRPEYIIDQGYHNNTNRVPSKEFKDFQKFQQREVAKLMKVLVDICHENGREAMMFLGDHWIGTEPFGEYFKEVGLDAVVGSVGNGTTLRLISDIPGVKYTEGRFLPYFFPDVFHEGGDPIREAKVNWVTARRAILRKPIDRIGYGGYLKLALQFPDFIQYIEEICDEFRLLYENVGGQTPYNHFTVGVLNSWGKLRSWGTHMVAHAIDYKQTYSYAGVLEGLSGMPFDVKFISFDDVIENPSVLKECSVVINVGDAYTAPSGGSYWLNPAVSCAVKEFVAEGGGLIGVGEPSACQHEGRYFALASVLGVDKEVGFSLSTDKYNWETHSHFITEDSGEEIQFGEGMKNIYALPDAKILRSIGQDVQMAVHEFGKGRSVYLSGIPYSFENSRMLYRAIFWAAGREQEMKKWYSDNFNVEVNYYPATGKYCVVNNTYEPQETVIYNGEGKAEAMSLKANDILWFEA